MIGTKTKATAAAKAPRALSERPLYVGGPSEAQLADPASFWHVAGDLERAEYLRELGKPSKLYDMQRQWDDPMNGSHRSHREDARKEAGLIVDDRDPGQPWPQEVTDPFGYYVHQSLRNHARTVAARRRKLDEQRERDREARRCRCCGQVDHSTRAGRSALADVRLCDACAGVVMLERRDRDSRETIDGQTRRALAAALLNETARC